MRQFFWSVLGCLALVQAQAASFDCAKARTPMEKTICGDTELSRLDEDLNKAYRQALQRVDTSKGVHESQRQWLKNELGACQDAACMKQAYQRRIAELGLAQPSDPEPVNKPAGSPLPTAEQVARQIPRAYPKTRPPVCNAVVNAANRGALRELEFTPPDDGLLFDINGDGEQERIGFEEKLAYLDYAKVHVATKDGMPIEFNPVPEEERDSELVSESLIKYDGKLYILGTTLQYGPAYIAVIGKDNKEQIVCEFGEIKPVVTIVSSRNDPLCKLGLEHNLSYVPFAGKRHGVKSFDGEDVKMVAGRWQPGALIVETSFPNEASIDINNDGKPDRLVGLHIITGAANPPCVGERLAVLSPAGNHLDKLLTPLLPGFECMTGQAPLMFGGQSYIEVGEKIQQLKGNKLDTICEFHTQPMFQILKH